MTRTERRRFELEQSFNQARFARRVDIGLFVLIGLYLLLAIMFIYGGK